MFKWGVVCALATASACNAGVIEEPRGDLSYRERSVGTTSTTAGAGAVVQAPPLGTHTAESLAPSSDASAKLPRAGTSAPADRAGGSSAAAGSGQPIDGPLAGSSVTSVGSGDMDDPLPGPAPTDAAKFKGAPFVLVKNWDFGAQGNIRNIRDLNSEFAYTDHWGTIANGTNYGAVIVAPGAEQAVSAPNLGLPGNRQPVEDPARPIREWTDQTLLAHVRPLSPTQPTVSASKHDAGCGSFTAKWKLPSGGALLGKDLLWETRVRMPVALSGYWFAIWTAGEKWDRGAEMDVMESFGAPHIPANAFHTNSVGGSDVINFASWPPALDKGGVPNSARDLKQWHTWTWVYLKDDSYVVFYDGFEVQRGKIHWTLSGSKGGSKIDMTFLFDFGWGHTQVSDVNISLPASKFALTYEIDYSRVYLR